ncbi:guanine nucleotide exchange factor synembryn-like protein [Trichocladium antarcticum]|uniref:Guanine nucleotide exchange factor synembryn-like protein n=1 Tax=Trichocladium antarcticum TaxID=1450529 RepID=A0AAN6ZF00_9PEZI|nr:guanine nucleotide exchange factor synembryn-like protein [Trichocladium antarcticum]
MAHLTGSASLGSLRGPAKLKAVTKLVDGLAEDLESATLQPQERDAALDELKIYGRDPSYSDPIFTKEGIETLTRFAFDSPSETTSRNSLRVICNAMLLKPETRQIFVDLGYEPKVCSKLKTDSWDDEFLISRVVFLTTYGTSIDLPNLIEQHQLADSIIQNLSKHATRCSTPPAGKISRDPMEKMALDETLKLLFNVTRYASDHTTSFDPAIPHIVTILCNHDLPPSTTPLDPPFSLLINALMNLNLVSPSAQPSLYPSDNDNSVATRLLELLDLSMKAYTDTALEQNVTPLICVLSSVYENAPSSSDPESPVRTLIRSQLLPSETDRSLGLGKADTLPSRLLRNWTNALAPEFRKAISHLYFELSGKDAGQFIENVGYGYASGFLFQNKIAVPEGAMQQPQQQGRAGEGSGLGVGVGVGVGRRAVNPITGQFLSEERFEELPEMTMEEKEREAERLFVLFERLKQTGVVSVQNPVETAMQEGRFEELPDSDDEKK